MVRIADHWRLRRRLPGHAAMAPTRPCSTTSAADTRQRAPLAHPAAQRHARLRWRPDARRGPYAGFALRGGAPDHRPLRCLRRADPHRGYTRVCGGRPSPGLPSASWADRRNRCGKPDGPDLSVPGSAVNGPRLAVRIRTPRRQRIRNDHDAPTRTRTRHDHRLAWAALLTTRRLPTPASRRSPMRARTTARTARPSGRKTSVSSADDAHLRQNGSAEDAWDACITDDKYLPPRWRARPRQWRVEAFDRIGALLWDH